MKPYQINILVVGAVFALIAVPFFITLPDLVAKSIDFAVQAFLVVSAGWVYADARKLDIQKYKPTLWGRGPISYSLGVLILWIVCFPAYISIRQKVKDGKMPLREIKEKQEEVSRSV